MKTGIPPVQETSKSDKNGAIGEELLELDLEECASSCQNSPDFTSFLHLVCREHLKFFLISIHLYTIL